jgi:hypothetical protein
MEVFGSKIAKASSAIAMSVGTIRNRLPPPELVV